MNSQFDESTFPLRMIAMATECLSKGEDQMIMNSPFHKKKILFSSGSYSPYCTRCKNSLVIVEEKGYIQPLFIGYCDKCNLSWQVCRLNRDISSTASTPDGEKCGLVRYKKTTTAPKITETINTVPSDEHIRLIIEQTACTEENAREAFTKSNGDVIEAIMSLLN